MCVAQFREYCKASRFNHSKYNEDLLDNNLEVKKHTEWHHGRANYYVTDLKAMRELSMNGNSYAKMHLKNNAPTANHEAWYQCPQCQSWYDKRINRKCPDCKPLKKF